MLRKIGSVLPVMLVMVLLVGCSAATSRRTGSQEQKQVLASGEQVQEMHTIVGVIRALDVEQSMFTMRELDCDTDTMLFYDQAARITDKYGEEITGEEIEIGAIMEVTYGTKNARVESMNVPQEVWEYKQVDKFSFNQEESSMKVAGKKYQVTDQTYFSDQGKHIEQTELHAQDELTVRGVGIRVYSVVRTTGHGYVRLADYEDFVGGLINIGNQVILPVTERMLITVKAGTYTVTMTKHSLAAVKKVDVQADREVTLDFGEYKTQVENVGMITFAITPEGSDLYINGTQVDYSEPVALSYGEYSIRVEMTGYTTFTGTLEVAEAASSLDIDLIEGGGSVEEDNQTQEDASSETSSDAKQSDSEEDSGETVTKKIDSNHTIKVTEPEGAEVYLDNVYKGIVPCKFTKVIGSQTVTLSQTGYVTKSYSVDVLDDDKNVTLQFARLAEDEDGDTAEPEEDTSGIEEVSEPTVEPE